MRCLGTKVPTKLPLETVRVSKLKSALEPHMAVPLTKAEPAKAPTMQPPEL